MQNKEIVSDNQEIKSFPLHEACLNEDFKKVKSLLKQGSFNINEKTTYDGRTALHDSCYKGNIKITKLLIANKADINIKDNSELIPLHHACNSNHKALVRYLLSQKADINHKTKNNTIAIHHAALFHSIGMLTFLIKNNANINAKDSKGHTPINYTILMNRIEHFKVLLNSKADVKLKDTKNNTLLHTYVHSKHKRLDIKILQSLLKNNIDPNAKNNNGEYAIGALCQRLQYDAIRLLIEAKAELNLCNPIHHATQKGNIAFMKFLIKNKASIYKKDDEGLSVMHYACYAGKLNVIAFLLSCNISLYQTNYDQINTMHSSALFGRTNVIAFMLCNSPKQFDINATTILLNATPLYCAAHANKLETVKLLLENNADPNICDCNGKLPDRIIKNKEIKYLIRKTRTTELFHLLDSKTTTTKQVITGLKQGVLLSEKHEGKTMISRSLHFLLTEFPKNLACELLRYHCYNREFQNQAVTFCLINKHCIGYFKLPNYLMITILLLSAEDKTNQLMEEDERNIASFY